MTSTQFDKLQGRLEDSFNVHGIPESITHDNGPCYNSADWKKFARKWGFQGRACTPEHPQANGIAERFMGVLVKVVHAAVASNQDPRVEVRRRLMNYRNTPHPSTGKTPAELMIRRQIRTRVPMLMKSTTEKVDVEAKAMDRVAREKRKDMFDNRKHAKTKEVIMGDKVLVKQAKPSVKPPFDPKPYVVTEVKGTQVTARRGTKERKRNQVKMKVVKERPEHLQPRRSSREQAEDSESDESDVDIQLNPDDFQQGQEEWVQEQVRDELQEQVQVDPVQQELRLDVGAPGGDEEQLQQGVDEPVDIVFPDTGVRRSGRKGKVPERYGVMLPQHEARAQLSPRNRKRIQSLAKRGVPRKEWRIRQTSQDNLVMILQKKIPN